MKANNENNSSSVAAVERPDNSVFGAIKQFGRGLMDAGRSLVRKVAAVPVVKAAAVAVGAWFAGETAAQAQSTAPDASAIVTTATTTFNTVGALVASAVGFFIIVKIVKWIRK